MASTMNALFKYNSCFSLTFKSCYQGYVRVVFKYNSCFSLTQFVLVDFRT